MLGRKKGKDRILRTMITGEERGREYITRQCDGAIFRGNEVNVAERSPVKEAG